MFSFVWILTTWIPGNLSGEKRPESSRCCRRLGLDFVWNPSNRHCFHNYFGWLLSERPPIQMTRIKCWHEFAKTWIRHFEWWTTTIHLHGLRCVRVREYKSRIASSHVCRWWSQLGCHFVLLSFPLFLFSFSLPPPSDLFEVWNSLFRSQASSQTKSLENPMRH